MFGFFRSSKTPFPTRAGNAICYSGYRDGQSPDTSVFPSYEQIREDLTILADHWQYLRVYDCSTHAETVLEVIRRENFDFKVMLGMGLGAEVNNPDCPWGGEYEPAQLKRNRKHNRAEAGRMIKLANRYRREVFALSIGNEASVDWNDHMVPVDSLIGYARHVRRKTRQPVTFCENYVPWSDKLKPLAAELDVIALHTYPVWEDRSLDEALDYTKANYASVKQHYPDTPVIITEAGWTTASNGRGIDPDNASEALQSAYCRQLLEWAQDENILCFLFEAFDEPWKGSPDPMEPEKHWGIYKVDRTPKPVVEALRSLLE